METETKEIQISCADNFRLSAKMYRSQQLKAAVMIAPATGIKKQFYNSFAQYLAENGFGVNTYVLVQGIVEPAGRVRAYTSKVAAPFLRAQVSS